RGPGRLGGRRAGALSRAHEDSGQGDVGQVPATAGTPGTASPSRLEAGANWIWVSAVRKVSARGFAPCRAERDDRVSRWHARNKGLRWADHPDPRPHGGMVAPEA